MSPKVILKITTALVGIVVLAGVVWIMATGRGIQDSLDFGAGAYYYADIPDFDRYVRDDVFSTAIPYWVYVLLFLGWGALMYLLWIIIDRRR